MRVINPFAWQVSKYQVIMLCLLFIGFPSHFIFGQQKTQKRTYSEAEIIFENSVRKSNLINVKFNKNVFPLPPGVRKADSNQISDSFPSIIALFERLERKYGHINFFKKIPDANWGDVWATHKLSGLPVRIHDMSQLFAIRFSQIVPIDSIISELNELGEVAYSQPPVQVVHYDDPDDPCYDDASGCPPVIGTYPHDDQWNLKIIEAAKAWGITKGIESIKVGIIDDQDINRDHKELASKLTSDGDTDVNTPGGIGQHGTNIAGVIGAETDNSDGIASLGWNLKMAFYRFSQGVFDDSTNDDGDGSLSYEISRARSEGMDIISLSLGTYTDIGPCQVSVPYDDVQETIENAISVGVIVVVATGNDSLNTGQSGCEAYFPYVPYPAYNENADVIGVTATKADDDSVGNYNYEEPDEFFIDVAAPGWEILTTTGDDTFAVVNGTSYSAPLVAALAGLIKSISPGLEQDQILNVLKESAEKVGTVSYGIGDRNHFLGHGRINAFEALKYTLENYGGTLQNDLIIEEGDTWDFEEGVKLELASNTDIVIDGTLNIAASDTFEFGSNAGIIVNGTLNVNGEQGDSVLFRRSGAGYWSGIQFEENSTGTVSYAIIDYAYNSDGISIVDASPTIEHSTITNCLWGLNLNNSNSTIKNCNLNGNDEGVIDRYSAADYLGNEILDSFGGLTEGHGMDLIDTDPHIEDNIIYGNNYGIYGFSGASIALGESNDSTGNNVIAQNSVGVFANGSTYIYLGDENSSWGGDNSVYDNSAYDAEAISSSHVLAENTWWGSASGGDIYYDGTSGVHDDYKLSSDPNDPLPLIAPTFVDDVSNSSKSEVKRPTSLSKKSTTASKDEILDLIKRRNLFRRGKATGFISYLESTIAEKVGTETTDFAKTMLALEYYLDGQHQKALELAESNLASFADTDKETRSFLALFDIYLYGLKDQANAEGVLSQFSGKYPNDPIARRLQFELGRALSKDARGKRQNNQDMAENESNSLFDFRLAPNYPNPFNPTTTIEFSLREESHVVMRIYNIRGQLVKELVNEIKPVGKHVIIWDTNDYVGKSVASGTYFLSMTAGENHFSQKMTVLK